MVDLVEPNDRSEIQAEPFQKMHDLIVHNAGQTFGGSFVIVPPEGESITSLFLNQASLGMFWATLKSVCEQQLNEVDATERKLRQGFGR